MTTAVNKSGNRRGSLAWVRSVLIASVICMMAQMTAVSAEAPQKGHPPVSGVPAAGAASPRRGGFEAARQREIDAQQASLARLESQQRRLDLGLCREQIDKLAQEAASATDRLAATLHVWTTSARNVTTEDFRASWRSVASLQDQLLGMKLAIDEARMNLVQAQRFPDAERQRLAKTIAQGRTRLEEWQQARSAAGDEQEFADLDNEQRELIKDAGKIKSGEAARAKENK